MGHELRVGNNVTICLEPDLRAETDRLYATLSEGGSESTGMQQMPWRTGVQSRPLRGVRWMFICYERLPKVADPPPASAGTIAALADPPWHWPRIHHLDPDVRSLIGPEVVVEGDAGLGQGRAAAGPGPSPSCDSRWSTGHRDRRRS